jgi:hypothetical protein
MMAVSRTIQFLVRPWHAVSAAIELRRLRREFPNAHRRLVFTPSGAMPESDASYLDRLRDFYWDREEETNRPRSARDVSPNTAPDLDLTSSWPIR